MSILLTETSRVTSVCCGEAYRPFTRIPPLYSSEMHLLIVVGTSNCTQWIGRTNKNATTHLQMKVGIICALQKELFLELQLIRQARNLYTHACTCGTQATACSVPASIQRRVLRLQRAGMLSQRKWHVLALSTKAFL